MSHQLPSRQVRKKASTSLSWPQTQAAVDGAYAMLSIAARSNSWIVATAGTTRMFTNSVAFSVPAKNASGTTLALKI
jgi:hypothetical protein